MEQTNAYYRVYRFKIKTTVNLGMNGTLDTAEQVNIIMPRSVVRTISLEKLRQPSPLAEKHTSNNMSQVDV